METYCETSTGHPYHGPYHDAEYGFPVLSDEVLFERLILEINQAGLSWLTILKKRESFRKAFAGFDIDAVAAFDNEDRERLLSDPGIIRNRLKIEAAIHNARKLCDLRSEHGSFQGWLAAHHPGDIDDWLRLFRGTFKFVGREIVREFLVSTGFLPGAHHPDCPIYATVLLAQPPWLEIHSVPEQVSDPERIAQYRRDSSVGG